MEGKGRVVGGGAHKWDRRVGRRERGGGGMDWAGLACWTKQRWAVWENERERGKMSWDDLEKEGREIKVYIF